LRLSSFGGYGLALAALALVLFGAYDSDPAYLLFGGYELWRLLRWRLRFLAISNAP